MKNDPKSSSKYTEEDIFKMLEFFIDNIVVHRGIPMETNYALLLADLFLRSYEGDFIADLTRRKEHRLARSFDLSFLYKDDVLLNNPGFGDFIHRIYPKELRLRILQTLQTQSYLDLQLEINGKGKVLTRLRNA